MCGMPGAAGGVTFPTEGALVRVDPASLSMREAARLAFAQRCAGAVLALPPAASRRMVVAPPATLPHAAAYAGSDYSGCYCVAGEGSSSGPMTLRLGPAGDVKMKVAHAAAHVRTALSAAALALQSVCTTWAQGA